MFGNKDGKGIRYDKSMETPILALQTLTRLTRFEKEQMLYLIEIYRIN